MTVVRICPDTGSLSKIETADSNFTAISAFKKALQSKTPITPELFGDNPLDVITDQCESIFTLACQTKNVEIVIDVIKMLSPDTLINHALSCLLNGDSAIHFFGSFIDSRSVVDRFIDSLESLDNDKKNAIHLAIGITLLRGVRIQVGARTLSYLLYRCNVETFKSLLLTSLHIAYNTPNRPRDMIYVDHIVNMYPNKIYIVVILNELLKSLTEKHQDSEESYQKWINFNEFLSSIFLTLPITTCSLRPELLEHVVGLIDNASEIHQSNVFFSASKETKQRLYDAGAFSRIPASVMSRYLTIEDA